jgi:hypothetical protein
MCQAAPGELCKYKNAWIPRGTVLGGHDRRTPKSYRCYHYKRVADADLVHDATAAPRKQRRRLVRDEGRAPGCTLVQTATALATTVAAAAERRAFFAERSPGDKISWGVGRSGVIQKIEDDYVTILDDGWPADPPLIFYRAPFVVRMEIIILVRLALVDEALPMGDGEMEVLDDNRTGMDR